MSAHDPALAPDPAGGWSRIAVVLCDRCPRRALWRHRGGGYRCGRCAKPGLPRRMRRGGGE